jgi:hypothetical protein
VPQAVNHYAPHSYLRLQPLLHRKLAEAWRDANPPWAARTYALLSVAAYDAAVAAWDAKFHSWVACPYRSDPGLAPLLPGKPRPDYPSAHARQAGAAEAVLERLFPRDAASFAV